MKPDTLIGFVIMLGAGWLITKMMGSGSTAAAGGFSAATYNDPAGNYIYRPDGVLATSGNYGPMPASSTVPLTFFGQ